MGKRKLKDVFPKRKKVDPPVEEKAFLRLDDVHSKLADMYATDVAKAISLFSVEAPPSMVGGRGSGKSASQIKQLYALSADALKPGGVTIAPVITDDDALDSMKYAVRDRRHPDVVAMEEEIDKLRGVVNKQTAILSKVMDRLHKLEAYRENMAKIEDKLLQMVESDSAKEADIQMLKEAVIDISREVSNEKV